MSVSAKKRNIRGKDYYGPVVFKVLEKDAFGRPTTVEIGYDDTVFKLDGGESFFIGYISASAVEGAITPKGKA